MALRPQKAADGSRLGVDTAGDVVVAACPAVDNPSEPGEYTVEVTLNEAQTRNGTVTIPDGEGN